MKMLDALLQMTGLRQSKTPAHVTAFDESRRRLERAEMEDDPFSQMMHGMATKTRPRSKRSKRTKGARP